VGTQEERLALGGRLDPGVEVPHGGTDLCAGFVLVDLKPAIADIHGHEIGHRALLPGGLGTAASSVNRSRTSGGTGR
jgi:hypothetical protein